MNIPRFIMLDCDGETNYTFDYQFVQNGNDEFYIVDVSRDGEYWYTEELTEDEYYNAMCEYMHNETEKAGAVCGSYV